MNSAEAQGGNGDVRVVLLERAGCHLCEQAWPIVAAESAAAGVAVVRVDVDDNPDLRAAYGDAVPVVLVDGHEVARYRVPAGLLRSALAR